MIAALDVWCWLLALLAAVSAGSCILVVGSRRRSPRVALRAIADIETDLHWIAGVTGGSISEGHSR